MIAELESGGRILVSRLQYLGDVVLTLPMVRLIRDRFPRAEIDYLSRGAGADILIGEPMFSRVFRFPDKGEGWSATWRLIRSLRSRRYAVAIDLYSNPRSAIATWLTGATMRVGGARRGRRHLYTHPTRVPGEIRAAARFHIEHLKPLRVEGEASKPRLHISQREREDALLLLKDHGIDAAAPVIGIHPGGKWEVKRWPAVYFAGLARRLVERYGFQVVVMCGPGEESYQEAVRGDLGTHAAYLPVLPIRETAAVIEAIDGMVVSDGGVMHVAVAVETPTVGIFGSAEPDIWFPYEEFGPYKAAWVPITCRPCHMHTCSHISCLHNLTEDMVEQKLMAVVQDSLGSRSTKPATS